MGVGDLHITSFAFKRVVAILLNSPRLHIIVDRSPPLGWPLATYKRKSVASYTLPERN